MAVDGDGEAGQGFNVRALRCVGAPRVTADKAVVCGCVAVHWLWGVCMCKEYPSVLGKSAVYIWECTAVHTVYIDA